MKHSPILFSFLLFSFISNASPAAYAVPQDLQSQEKRESSQTANSTESEEPAAPKPDDLPFMGRPIVSVEFRGNKAFTSEALFKGINHTKPGEKFDLLTRERLQSDLDRLRVSLYVDHGYLQARFHEPELENTPTGVKITIPVEEGVVYRIGEVEIVDAKVFSPDEIKEIIGLKKGEIIKAYSDLNRGMEALKRQYSDRGYAGMDVFFAPEFHDPTSTANEGVVDAQFVIEEGEMYRIGKITYKAPDTGTEELIRSNLLLHETEIFNGTLLDASIEKLYPLLKQENFYHICFQENHQAETDGSDDPIQITFHLQKEPVLKSAPVLLKRKK